MSVLIKTRDAVLGNRNLALLGWWKMDEGKGNILYDSSGRNNHLQSGLPAGFGASFWSTDGVASFNDGVQTDCAIIGPNNSTATNVARKPFPLISQAVSPLGRRGSWAMVCSYTPIATHSATGDLFSYKGGAGDGINIVGCESGGGAKDYHLIDGTTDSPTAASWNDTFPAGVTDECTPGGKFDVGLERRYVLVWDADGGAGRGTYYLNYTASDGTSVDAFTDQDCGSTNWNTAFDISSGADNGYTFSIGSRGARVETDRWCPMRLRDFQFYAHHTLADAATTFAALKALNRGETLGADDWT